MLGDLRIILGQIRSLELVDCPITNNWLKENLRGATTLRILSIIGRVQITDQGLGHLKDLKKLEALDRARTPITDAGLEHLIGLTSLRKLNVSGTGVTEEGTKRLPQALPS
jgi:hypothetical protein